MLEVSLYIEGQQQFLVAEVLSGSRRVHVKRYGCTDISTLDCLLNSLAVDWSSSCLAITIPTAWTTTTTALSLDCNWYRAWSALPILWDQLSALLLLLLLLLLFHSNDTQRETKVVVEADHWVKQVHYNEQEYRCDVDHVKQVLHALPKDSSQHLRQLESRFASQVRTVCVDGTSEALDAHVSRIMEVLTEKLGPNGELWYDPSEIRASWVKQCLLDGGVFVYCVDSDDHVVGCIAGSPLSRSVYAMECEIAGRRLTSRPGYEVTHMVVLARGGGAYAGLAAYMSHYLVQRLKGALIIFDCTYDRNKADGGGAWKVPHKSPEFTFAGCCFRYTGIVADPKRPSWHGNNHLCVYYCDQAKGRL